MSENPKVAIVTAGGRGMGAASARALHACGYKLALMSPTENAERLAKELGGVATRGSTAEAKDIDALFELTMRTYGRVDAAVLQTGGPPQGDLLAITDKEWEFGLNLLLLNVIRLCRLITPVMEKQSTGAIVNLTTFHAFEPNLRYPVSSTLRAALSAFTKLYAGRYAAAGIRMNCVLPGFIKTASHTSNPGRSIPMGRSGEVEEIAKTVAFLLSDDAGYITGQSLRVDGGVTRHV
ncbi:MAG: SDR family oxidoreductase [Alphaproteobacteria bacterium]|nr:SDR family oxidoreductase [Alphaproteobacteria bacterium]